jgi:hypothetical protein
MSENIPSRRAAKQAKTRSCGAKARGLFIDPRAGFTDGPREVINFLGGRSGGPAIFHWFSR